MLIVRWVGWIDGPVLPVYPGADAPPEVPFLGITVAEGEAVRLMGDLLAVWAAARLAEK